MSRARRLNENNRNKRDYADDSTSEDSKTTKVKTVLIRGFAVI